MYNSDGKCLIQISDYKVFLNLIHPVDDILRLAEVTKGVSVNRAKRRFQGLNCGGFQQWRLRENDHWGRRKTKGMWSSENEWRK